MGQDGKTCISRGTNEGQITSGVYSVDQYGVIRGSNKVLYDYYTNTPYCTKFEKI